MVVPVEAPHLFQCFENGRSPVAGQNWLPTQLGVHNLRKYLFLGICWGIVTLWRVFRAGSFGDRGNR